MDLSLQGKHALICGSSQGIGLAIAKELAILGADCTLMARNAESLQTAVSQLHKHGSQHHNYLLADFGDTASVQKAINNLLLHSPVHILINNTGGPPAGAIVNATIQEFYNAYNAHLVNNHILTTAVLPGMQKVTFGRVINIISTSVKTPLHNLGVSNTTRAAVAGWAKTMANEVAKYGITVNNVLPGATHTLRLQNIINNKASKTDSSVVDITDEMLHEIPMGRFGKAEEIAALAAFLASPAAAYITGQSICVDGGRTASI